MASEIALKAARKCLNSEGGKRNIRTPRVTASHPNICRLFSTWNFSWFSDRAL